MCASNKEKIDSFFVCFFLIVQHWCEGGASWHTTGWLLFTCDQLRRLFEARKPQIIRLKNLLPHWVIVSRASSALQLMITMAKRREAMIDYQSGLLHNVGTRSGSLASVIAWNVTWLVVSHCWKRSWPSPNSTRRHPTTSPFYKTAFVAWSSGRCGRQRVWRLIMLFRSHQLKVHRNGDTLLVTGFPAGDTPTLTPCCGGCPL